MYIFDFMVEIMTSEIDQLTHIINSKYNTHIYWSIG